MMKFKALLVAAILSLTPLSVFAEMVNINKADAATFQHYLKGVGETKAKDIVSYRAEHKSFQNIEDIMKVKGIGEGIFTKIKKDLSLTEGVTSAPTKQKKASTKKDEPTVTKKEASKNTKEKKAQK